MIYNVLRSAAMSTGLAAVVGAIGCVLAVAAGAATLTHPSASSAPSTLDQAILQIDPSGYWPMTDPSGSTSAQDNLGQNADLTLTGSGRAPIFGVEGPDGNTAVKFRTALRRQIMVGPAMPAAGTIVFAVNVGTSPSNDFCLFEPRNGSQNFARIQIDATSGRVTFGDTHGAFVASDASIADGTWHAVAVTFTGSTATLWVDGDAQGSTSVVYSDGYPTAAGFLVGNQTGARIGHVAFADTAATPAELHAIADAIAGG